MENYKMPSSSSPDLAKLIVLLALIIFMTGQLVAGYHDHQSLKTALTNQNAAYAQSARVRQQLTGLAGQVAVMAQNGDSEARSIVADFAKQGVKFSAPAAIRPSAN
jgi:hypothetical protein